MLRNEILTDLINIRELIGHGLDMVWTWTLSMSSPIPVQPMKYFGLDVDWTGPGTLDTSWTHWTHHGVLETKSKMNP